MKTKNFFKKIVCFSLIFTMLPIYPPTTVRADNTSGHDSYFLETLLNSEGGYDTTLHSDSVNFGDSLEEKTMKKVSEETRDDEGNSQHVYLNWIKYSVTEAGLDPIKVGALLDEPTTDKKTLTDETGLIFSFPSNERGARQPYTKDYDRASKVSSTLSTNLNSLISLVKGKIGYTTLTKNENSKSGSVNKISDSITISRLLNPASDTANVGAGNDYFTKVSVGDFMDIYYAKPETTKYKEYLDLGVEVSGELPIKNKINPTKNLSVPMIDASGNLLAYVFPQGTTEATGTDSENTFIWAMPKGYLSPVDGTVLSESQNPWGVGGTQSSNNQGDSVWLTIFSLAEYANAQAQFAGYTTAQAEGENQSFIENELYNIIMGLYSGLLNLLKLSTITELIYEKGTMTNSWWNQVLKYHLIFQIVAWMMLIVAVAKILIQINFSTVNPTVRMSIMDTGQKLLTVGFALALCIPFIRMLEDLNYLIVNIFKTQVISEGDIISGMSIAGIVILLGYFSITFTMNCIYIMRSIMIALLTASAPLFITSMAFSGPKQKGLMDNWIKEISANIFMQAIHAFTFAFLWDIMDNSRILIRLVIYFSLLPIVDSFRSLIFGQAGSFAVNQGQKASQAVGGFIESKGLAQAKGALSSKMKSSALNNQLPVNAAASGGEGATSGESKGAKAGADLSTTARNIGTAVFQGGEGLFKNAKGIGKEGSKLQKGTKAAGDFINKHTQAGSFASKVADAGLKLGANALDNFEAAGGFTNNAVAKANRGDSGGSVEASQKHAAYVQHSTERNFANAGDAARNASKAIKERQLKNYNEKDAELTQQINEATSTGNHSAIPGLVAQQTKNLQKMNKVYSKYQKGRRAGANFYKQGEHVHANFAERELEQNRDGTYNLSRATYDMWTQKQKDESQITEKDFENRDVINIGYGRRNSETGQVSFINFDQQIYNQRKSFGNTDMNEYNQKKLDKQTTAVDRAEETLGLKDSDTTPSNTANKLNI